MAMDDMQGLSIRPLSAPCGALVRAAAALWLLASAGIAQVDAGAPSTAAGFVCWERETPPPVTRNQWLALGAANAKPDAVDQKPGYHPYPSGALASPQDAYETVAANCDAARISARFDDRAGRTFRVYLNRKTGVRAACSDDPKNGPGITACNILRTDFTPEAPGPLTCEQAFNRALGPVLAGAGDCRLVRLESHPEALIFIGPSGPVGVPGPLAIPTMPPLSLPAALPDTVASAAGFALPASVPPKPASDRPMTLLDQLFSPTTLIQVLVGSAVMTAFINAIWFFVSIAVREFWHRRSAEGTVHDVAFSRGMTKERYDAIKDLIEGFSCLLVRYGTDQYVSTLASDQEKYECRLKNAVLPINIGFDPVGNAVLKLKLPVHKRLGSQFKCFITAKDEGSLAVVEEFLKGCDRIKETNVSQSVKSNRIYFLLNERFGVVKTIDGLTNNMIYPE